MAVRADRSTSSAPRVLPAPGAHRRCAESLTCGDQTPMTQTRVRQSPMANGQDPVARDSRAMAHAATRGPRIRNMFDDLPPDLARLLTLRVWHTLWLQRIDAKIA